MWQKYVCAFLLYTSRRGKPITTTKSRTGNRKLLTVQKASEKKNLNVCIKIMFIFWRLDSISLFFLHFVSLSLLFRRLKKKSRSLTRRLAFGMFFDLFFALSKLQNGVLLRGLNSNLMLFVFCFLPLLTDFIYHFKQKEVKIGLPRIEHHAGLAINVGKRKRKLRENNVCVNRILHFIK